MRKLTLRIDELEVESFEAAPEWQAVGTVEAAQQTEPFCTPVNACNPYTPIESCSSVFVCVPPWSGQDACVDTVNYTSCLSGPCVCPFSPQGGC